ncbi:Zn-dependent protease [Thalassotalea insulae]|uniref:Zn-dependent protease n=1 Tax=Thalassotalea insulae TaxID=2056778 RepID=A0ABQ6GLK2_9GAMM|nr:M48 family metallopeptidase [Thalassotalea insulae]GLX76890.1 Zn-dependent protease [Thalassotalea insulae]
MNSKILLSSAIISAVIALSGCAKSSTGRNQITLFSNSELNQMGISSFEQLKQKEKISTDKATNQFVQCVASAVTKNVPKSTHSGDWEVVVFDSEQVNAFALPGGKIGVYTGILKVTENQDQLAAIIGHEVAHVIERHSNERLSSNQITQIGAAAGSAVLTQQGVENKEAWMMAGLAIAQYGFLMPYSRMHESEADIVGQNLMAKSGFKPAAAIDLWRNMAKQSKGAPPEFLSTHPSNQTRINDLTQHLAKSQQLLTTDNRPNCRKPKSI